MEDNAQLFESLLEKATEYIKTSLELAKLKALDKTAEIVSAIVPFSLVTVLIASFLLFLNLGIALWFGDILGKTFYGFFVVSAFYLFTGILIRFFLHKWIKRRVGNYIVTQLLK